MSTPVALDISSNNHAGRPFNWQAAFAQGFRYAHIKATQGTSYVNPYFIQDCRDAKNAGFHVGIYHYLMHNVDAHLQATWFRNNGINQVHDYVDLLPIADDEDGTPDPNILQSFLHDVGEPCGVYCNRYFYQHVLNVNGAAFFWLAIPGWSEGQPLPAGNVAMVQTGTMLIHGIGDNANGAQLPTDCSIVLKAEVIKKVNAQDPLAKPLNAPIVGAANMPDDKGYWLVGADGGVFAFGEAVEYGGMAGHPLNRPIVAIIPSTSGLGYALVGADGGVFAYGDFPMHGSLPELGFSPAP